MTSKLQVDNIEGRATKGSINITEGTSTTVLQRAMCNTWAVTNQSGTMALSDSINSVVSDGGTGMSDYLFTVSYTTVKWFIFNCHRKYK